MGRDRWGRRLGLLAFAGILLALGCAHKRQVYYPNDAGSGVSVRAPFVDVQVQQAPKKAFEVDDLDD
jgi:hypothetical protein